MTTAKIQIFYVNGQNDQPKILPRNLTTKIPILIMTMTEMQILVKMVDFCLTSKFDHKITIFTIDHGAESRMSEAMIKFLALGQIPGCQWPWSNFLTNKHRSNSRVSWSWSMPYAYPHK